ncbi:uncharacterized protein LOC143024930 [Oratosquilla oratoria]|uniref:uncharacterized protein LOC143024930 n=1 Tax=Oratosquilla oratoria TaxID=337810 RepID=UPI003F75AECE
MTSKGRGFTWVALHTLTLLGGLCLFFGRQVLAAPTINDGAADDSALESTPGHSPADARSFQEQTYGPHPQGFARNYRSPAPLAPYHHGPSPFFYPSRAARSSPQNPPATAPDRGLRPVEDNTEELASDIERSVHGRTDHAQKFPFMHMLNFEGAPMAGNGHGVALVPMNPHQRSFRLQQEDAMLREVPVRTDEKSARTRRSASGSSYQNRVDRIVPGVMVGSEAFSLELLDPEDEPLGNVRERRALRRLDVAGRSPWRQYDVEAVDDDALWRYFGDDNGELAHRGTVKRNVALPEDVVLSALRKRDLYESDEEPKVVVEGELVEEDEEEEQEEEEEEGEAKEEGEVKEEGKHQMSTEKPSFIVTKKAKGKYSQSFKGLGGKMM